MNLEEDILIEKFLKGDLSKLEEESFQERMASDTEFKDKVNFERQLFDTLGDESWSFSGKRESEDLKAYDSLFSSDDARRFSQNFSETNKMYQDQLKRRSIRRWIFYSVAATITLLIILFGVDRSAKSSEELYFSYLKKSNVPSFTTRGESDAPSQLQMVQSLLDQEKYAEAEPILSNLLSQGNEAGPIYINLALSQMYLEAFDKAESTLNRLIKSDLLDAEKGYWYKSLLLLAKNEREQAKQVLGQIIANEYYNTELAQELLDEL